MDIGEKVAYLKGLAEGLEISSDSKNGKIIKGILDVLEDIAGAVEFLESENENLNDYLSELDEDLGALEEDYEKAREKPSLKEKNWLEDYLYDEEDDEDDDEFDEEDYEDEEYDDEFVDEFDDEDESEENELLDRVLEIKCPHCKKRVFIETDEILESEDISVECPECGKKIEIAEEGGCSCGHCPKRDEDENTPF